MKTTAPPTTKTQDYNGYGKPWGYIVTKSFIHGFIRNRKLIHTVSFYQTDFEHNAWHDQTLHHKMDIEDEGTIWELLQQHLTRKCRVTINRFTSWDEDRGRCDFMEYRFDFSSHKDAVAFKLSVA